MEASAEERSGYLDFSRVSPGELLGMGAALVLLASLWLPWFTTSSDNPNSKLPGGATGGDSASAWQVFSTLDWLLVAACAAPFILTWIIARGHALTWKPGEVTMIVGIVAFVLILCNGEHIGDGSPPLVDIAVDPLEGTELCAKGLPNAIATIALSERGTMFDPGPCVYMMKMATSRDLAHLLDLDRPVGETLRLMAREKGVPVGDLVVIMLDRPRHEEAMAEIRGVGARIRLIPHGDVSAALVAVTQDSPVDLLHGIGGAPRGGLAAAPLPCTGGQILRRLWAR